MILSMTGYGRGVCALDGRELTVEMKSVNHRYLDISMRLPRNIAFLEDTLRSCLAAQLCRGHIDIYVNYRNFRTDARVVSIDDALISQYVKAAKHISENSGIVNDLSASSLMRFPDVISVLEAEEDRDAVCELAKNAANIAIEELKSMRKAEGERLCSDLRNRAKTLNSVIDRINLRAPDIASQYRDKLNERIAQLLPEMEIDRARLATEVALFADRASVDEEITRLFSHLAQLDSILSCGGEVGRKLDFLVQEINREFNTIGSKANDGELVDFVLLGKAEIEKIREQVQNIE